MAEKIPEEPPTTVDTSQVINKLDLKGFSIMHLNIASLIKHIDQLRTILLDKPCHILSINETRLSENIDDSFVKINGYDICQADRNRAGGGVALYVKTAINANLRQNLVSHDLEVICLEIKRAKSKPFFVIRDLKIVVYGKRLTSDTLFAIKTKSLTGKCITYRIYSKYRKLCTETPCLSTEIWQLILNDFLLT